MQILLKTKSEAVTHSCIHIEGNRNYLFLYTDLGLTIKYELTDIITYKITNEKNTTKS